MKKEKHQNKKLQIEDKKITRLIQRAFKSAEEYIKKDLGTPKMDFRPL